VRNPAEIGVTVAHALERAGSPAAANP